MSEERPTNEAPANPETPTWAQPAEPPPAASNQAQDQWEQTPPPPPGAELEPGEQSNSTVRQEQQTGQVSGYNEQGISANDAEMGVQPQAAGTQQTEGGWRPGAGERRGGNASDRRASASGGGFVQKWQAIQAQFVDDPRNAVQQADQFFEELARKLNDERQQLRGLWDRGENASTEDLRVAMQRYRDYFKDRLS